MLAVDGLLLTVWAGSIAIAWGGPGRRSPLAFSVGVGVILLTGAGAVWLEDVTGGPLVRSPTAATIGTIVVLAGATLHAVGRVALGRHWGSVTTPGQDLVTTGPYAKRRHPVYAGLGLMALGTALAHPSVAVIAAMIGLAVGLLLKGHREDRALEAKFGPRWRAWAAEVPAWVRRPFRSKDTRQ